METWILVCLLAVCGFGHAEVLAPSGLKILAFGSATGSVIDAQSDLPISGVQVRVPLWKNPERTDDYVYTYALTDQQGYYSVEMPLLESIATYNISFESTNYAPATINNVRVRADEETIVEPLPYINRAVSGVGTVSGQVKNSLTGQGESGVLITFRKGFGVFQGTVVSSVTTGSGGSWSTTLDTGGYTAQLSKAGFTSAVRDRIISIGRQTTANQNGLITPIPPVGATRITLRWSASPSDLDSHITGPTAAGPRFHVYYSAKGSESVSPFTSLDHDIVTGHGPETVTIAKNTPGMYRYSVQDFTNRNSPGNVALKNSKAVVEVVQGTTVIHEFPVPMGAGTLWTVFEMTNGIIKPINTITHQPIPANVP